MANKRILAMDQGTTGSTCLMISETGEVLSRGYREIAQHFPRPGWVEHDAEEIFRSTLSAANEAIAAAGAMPDAIGITNQRETVVLWDRATGAPVARAIVWQDRRTAARCSGLASKRGRVSALTGLVIDPYFSATKLEWLLNEGGHMERAAAGELLAGTIDSWLVWRLTGGAVHATEPTNASRTMLYDLELGGWSNELCGLFGIPRPLLPEVRSSSGDFGETTPELFGRSIPIRGIAGDQQAALFGQGCFADGQAKQTYGTGAFLLMNTGQRRPPAEAGLLVTAACDAKGARAFAMEASIFIAGAAIQWLRDGLGIIETAPESEALARELDSTDGVYFVPALAGLGAPHWEPGARGILTGLTRGTGRAHLARAALEAMAYGTSDVLALMRERSGASASSFELLRVDGGASSNDWLLQFQADVLDVPVERPDCVDTTALGAAGLAGIGAGIWENGEEFVARRRFDRFEPGVGREAAEQGARGWQRAVNTALYWARSAG